MGLAWGVGVDLAPAWCDGRVVAGVVATDDAWVSVSSCLDGLDLDLGLDGDGTSVFGSIRGKASCRCIFGEVGFVSGLSWPVRSLGWNWNWDFGLGLGLGLGLGMWGQMNLTR
jgi:hypothetical protein